MKGLPVYILIRKEILTEWRQKYALGGILLYVVSTVFVIYMSLLQEGAIDELEIRTWNILFWITMLFAAVNAIARSFFQETRERMLYFFSITGPRPFIIAKMLYNTGLMLLLSLICYVCFGLFAGNPVLDYWAFFFAVFFGGTGLSLLFTMVSAIAGRAGNNATLVAILGFPLVLPLLQVLIRFSANAYMDAELQRDVFTGLVLLLSLNVLVFVLAYILFPYLWQD